MNPPDRISPYLGGPRARLPQILLFILHIALIVAIIWMAVLFARLQERFLFEPWQIIVFWGLVVICFLGFTWRAIRILRDLVAALREHRDRPPTSD
jgi:hypothetical protein